MNKDITETSKMLKILSDKSGVIYALSLFGNDINVSIPIRSDMLEMSADALNLSVRSSNCLMRANARTVSGIIDMIMSEKRLESIRNLGRKSRNEIKTVILAEAYERLSENGKTDFWQYVLTHNCRDIAAT